MSNEAVILEFYLTPLATYSKPKQNRTTKQQFDFFFVCFIFSRAHAIMPGRHNHNIISTHEFLLGRYRISKLTYSHSSYELPSKQLPICLDAKKFRNSYISEPTPVRYRVHNNVYRVTNLVRMVIRTNCLARSFTSIRLQQSSETRRDTNFHSRSSGNR